MRVVDLTEEHTDLYFVCLEDWAEEVREAGDHKRLWYERMKDKGLRVKLALDDRGEVGGMIQYGPIEESFVEGSGLHFVYCIWVHGYRKGRGNFQKKGMGKALLEAAELDAEERGARGMAAWGTSMPFWMKASWFRKHGYRKVDRNGFSVLLWKPFSDDAAPPRWLKQVKQPEVTPEVVTVTAFVNGWCTAQNMICERARRAAAEFGDKVVFRQIDTLDRRNRQEWGMADAVYVDEIKLRSGPPPSYKKIRRTIARKVAKLPARAQDQSRGGSHTHRTHFRRSS